MIQFKGRTMIGQIDENNSTLGSQLDGLITKSFSRLGRQERQTLINKTHVLAEEAKRILLNEAAESAKSGSKNESNANMPALRTPKLCLDSFQPDELVVKLTTLTPTMDPGKLLVKLQEAVASHNQYHQAAIGLADQLTNALNKIEKIGKKALAVHELKESVAKQERTMRQQKTEKEQLLLGLDKTNAQYGHLIEEIKQIDAEITISQAKLQQQGDNLRRKIGLAAQNLTNIEKIVEQQQNLPKYTQKPIDRHITNSARLSELISSFMQLINKNAELDLSSQLSLFEVMQKNLSKEMEKKADEIAAQQQKAADLQKTMGCLGKVIGAIVTALSVVSAVFTGGASFALAAVGVALMIGDSISESITGESITEQIMAPFMEYIFVPLMKVVNTVIDNVLEYTPLGQLLNLLGELTDSDVVGVIKNAMAAMITLALIVAISYVVKSAAGFLTKKLFGQTIEQLLKTLIPKILTAAVKQSSKKIVEVYTKGAAKFGISAQASAKRALQLQKLSQYVNYGNQSVQVTAQTVVADFKEKTTKIMASFTLSQGIQENIKQVLQAVIEQFEHSQSIYRDLAKLVSDAQHNEFIAGKYATTNMRI